MVKRVDLPTLLASAAAKISSGCNCLDLTTKTSVTALDRMYISKAPVP